MIQTRINMIHSNCIRAKLLHQACIGLALRDVGAEVERVELVGDTFDEPLAAI